MELRVQSREILGKKTKSLRRQGFIPAELYGRGMENIHLSVPLKDFQRILKQTGGNQIVHLNIGEAIPAQQQVVGGASPAKSDGALCGASRPALIHDIARHPVSDEILNIDFHQVRLDQKIRIKVPLEFTGEAPAIKDKDGVLVKAAQEVEIEALPDALPPAIAVGLSRLIDLNQSIYVRDLEVPAGVRVLTDAASVVVTVKPKMTEEEEKELEARAAPSVEQVVVEAEEKKAERQAKAGAEDEKGIGVKEKPVVQ